jgi:hypothetical protein
VEAAIARIRGFLHVLLELYLRSKQAPLNSSLDFAVLLVHELAVEAPRRIEQPLFTHEQHNV